MKPVDTTTEQMIKDCLRYDPEEGLLFWIKKINKNTPIGVEAGSTSGKRYRHLKVQGVNLLAHRVCWFLYFNSWPSGVLDHINGDTFDNRIVNLRDVNLNQNSQNRRTISCSKYKGVQAENSNKNPWKARIRVDGQLKHLGMFKTAEQAAKAYDAAATEYFGEFACLNFPREIYA